MKHDRWFAAGIAASLAFAVSFCGIGCLVTGMGIECGAMLPLALCCGVFSLLSAACFQIKGGGWIQLGLMALGLWLLLRSEAAAQQTAALLFRISRLYDNAYGWGLIQLGDMGDGIAMVPLAAWGCVAAVLTDFVVCRRKSALLAVIPGLLPLICCMVATDLVPAEGYLYPFLLALALLLLTDLQRRSDVRQANFLTALLVIPTALALGALFLAVPRESYVNNIQEYQDRVAQWLEELPSLFHGSSDGGFVSTVDIQNDQVNLRTLGPLVQRNYPVMTVTGGSGRIYLREQDYDLYNGTGWTATAGRREVFVGQGDLLEETTLIIEPNRMRDYRYLPYYPTEEVTLLGGQADNTSQTQSYAFAVSSLPENWRQELSREESLDPEIRLTAGPGGDGWYDSRYSILPNDTRVWAKEYLQGVLTGTERTYTDKADAIAAHVRSSARYDTNTGKMPADAGDFAQWFLENSETGYCVHFATSAVVLLRAAGIPARYVTGYAFTSSGDATVVRAKQAHAWAEYYEPQLGMWVVLEATPADDSTEETTSVAETSTTPAETETETENVTLPDPSVPIPTSPSISDPTAPEGQAEAPKASWTAPNWLKSLGRTLLWTGFFLALLHIQRILRIRWWRAKCHRGSPNARALARWRVLEMLYRRLGALPPEELRVLAEKARFSQHRLTPEELQSLDWGIRTAEAQCRARPWYRRLVDRYLFAAY